MFDDELTLHSGCPVREGEKWITTSWLREGVSERFPHHYYDANGVPVLYTDEGDYVEEEAIDKEGEDYEAYEEEEAYIDLAGEL